MFASAPAESSVFTAALSLALTATQNGAILSSRVFRVYARTVHQERQQGGFTVVMGFHGGVESNTISNAVQSINIGPSLDESIDRAQLVVASGVV